MLHLVSQAKTAIPCSQMSCSRVHHMILGSASVAARNKVKSMLRYITITLRKNLYLDFFAPVDTDLLCARILRGSRYIVRSTL